MGMKQFTYTATPWGVDAPGWSIFQSTEGLAPAVVRNFRAYYSYENLAGEERSPRKLTFAGQEGHGQTIVSQGCDCGLRWWDTKRGANYFSHMYLGNAQEALAGLAEDFNPMALYGAPCFQEDFPEELKAEAESKDRPALPPPLPEADGLASLETNPEFGDPALFARAEWCDWGKIGALAEWMHRRVNGEEPHALAYDARKTEGVDAMALALRLLPLQERKRTVFSTWMTATEQGSFPDGGKLVFFGTVQDGEADPDTGVYGQLQAKRLAFRGREDAEAFKRMVDWCGAALGAGDWEGLVACWEVATGRCEGAEKLMSAMAFAERFEGLASEVEEGLAGAFAASGVEKEGERAVALAAWFELGMGAFGDVAKKICGECGRNREALGDALRALAGADARTKFLEETHEQAKEAGGLPELAKAWLGLGADARGLVPADARNRAFGTFTARVDRFAGIRGTVKQGMVGAGQAAALLAEVEQAEETLGRDFDGMPETLTALRYQVALEKVGNFKDLAAFAREASELGVDEGKIRADGLKKAPLGWIPGDKLKAAVEAYGAIGVKPKELIAKIPDDRLLDKGVLDALVAIGANRDDIIRRAMETAVAEAAKRGREEGVKEERRRTEAEALARSKGRAWAAIRTGLIGGVLMAGCFAAGYGLRWWTEGAGDRAAEDEARGGRVEEPAREVEPEPEESVPPARDWTVPPARVSREDIPAPEPALAPSPLQEESPATRAQVPEDKKPEEGPAAKRLPGEIAPVPVRPSGAESGPISRGEGSGSGKEAGEAKQIPGETRRADLEARRGGPETMPAEAEADRAASAESDRPGFRPAPAKDNPAIPPRERGQSGFFNKAPSERGQPTQAPVQESGIRKAPVADAGRATKAANSHAAGVPAQIPPPVQDGGGKAGEEEADEGIPGKVMDPVPAGEAAGEIE